MIKCSSPKITWTPRRGAVTEVPLWEDIFSKNQKPVLNIRQKGRLQKHTADCTSDVHLKTAWQVTGVNLDLKTTGLLIIVKEMWGCQAFDHGNTFFVGETEKSGRSWESSYFIRTFQYHISNGEKETLNTNNNWGDNIQSWILKLRIDQRLVPQHDKLIYFEVLLDGPCSSTGSVSSGAAMTWGCLSSTALVGVICITDVIWWIHKRNQGFSGLEGPDCHREAWLSEDTFEEKNLFG